MEAFDRSAKGRIRYRTVVNHRVRLATATRAPVHWRPIAWGLVSSNSWPGHETTRRVVVSTDGKVRLVQTRWDRGRPLRVQVTRLLGRIYPGRLVAVADRYLYWVARGGVLRRAIWTRSGLIRKVTLPVTIRRATAITAVETAHGKRLYYTTKAGALHVVRDNGGRSADVVLRSSGYAGVIGLRADLCLSASYGGYNPPVGLLSVRNGVARYQRVLRPAAGDGGSLTKATRVRSTWSWRRLG